MENSSFQGQPHQAQATRSQPTGNCSACNEPPTVQCIICEKCQKVYHRNCIGIDNIQQSFTCDECVQQNCRPESPTSVHSHRSKVSNNSASLTLRNKILALRRLEEERQLAKERDTIFLNQKYQLLDEVAEETGDRSSVDVNSVHEWLNNQPKPSHLSETNQFSLLPRDNYPQINKCNGNNVVTHATSMSNPCHLVAQSSNNNNAINTDPLRTNIANKLPHSSLTSTSYNNNVTFINTNSSQPPTTTTAAPPHNNFLEAPANYAFRPSISSIPHSSFSPNITQQQVNARHSVPKDLPVFTGNPAEWPLFTSTYNWSTAVCGFTDAENLIRLQKALKGDALKAVQQILIHPSCVSAAISTLRLLYGQPEKILHSLKLKIRSLPAVNINKLETITLFATQVKGLQSTIEACGLTDEMNNPSLLQELISKLPSYFQINWGTYKMSLAKQDKKVNLSEFAEWIFDIGISASSVNIESSFSAAPESSSSSRQKNVYLNTHAEQRRRNCLVCSGNCNNVANCHRFKNADRTQRWNYVRELNLCKQCLHKHFGRCNNNKLCGVDNCKFRHHHLLHKKDEDVAKAKTSYVSDSNKNNDNQTQNCYTHNASSSNNLFKIIPITIYGNGNKFIETYAFIDDGSSTSLIDEQIIENLNLSGIAEPLCLKWTGSVERNEDNSRRLCLKISGPNKKVFNVDVRSVKQLSLPKQTLNLQKLEKDFPYLTGLPVKSYTDATPQILIGLNNSRLCIYDKIKEGKVNEPVAIHTRLGWLIYGSTRKNSFVEQHHYHLTECSNKILSDMMKKFYSIETAGIENPRKILSVEEEKAMDILQKYTIQRSDGHYETSLLWRNDCIELPNSYDMALKRYMCLDRKLRSDHNLNSVFNKTILEYISKGYITKINGDCLKPEKEEKVWYLPIFPVFNKNKPGKTRIVWDAAAKANGISLNDVLMKGPDMLCSLPSILIRFRQKSVAICGDIEQMFHQIFIRKEDRNAQRFLWRSDNGDKPDIYVMNVLIFGASCSPCISQYVKNINSDKFSDKYPDAAAAIKHNHYVDDYLDSFDTVNEAINLSLTVKYIHSKAGFNIRNWISNNKDVLAAVNGNDSQENKSLDLANGIETNKVLGVFWKSSSDYFTFRISKNIDTNILLDRKKIPTKRQLLKLLMSIYDPLGLIGHYLMYLKILLQDVWRSGVGWDEEIQPHHKANWDKWLSFLPEIQNIEIPRCYLQTFKNYEKVNVQIHTFADASENGYAAVSYFRISDGNDVVVSIIGSKTRVSPLRITSIPRLELMAAQIAARFSNNILQSTTIKIDKKIFWSDSKTVISWLRSEQRRYHQFVSFRVGEILETTNVEEWRWLPGKLNVADEATKWSRSGPDLTNNSRWLNGPPFLKSNEDSWPAGNDIIMNTDCELKQHIMHIEEINFLINIKRFSQYRRAIKALAYVIHYVNKLRKRNATNILSQDELTPAEIILIKQAQEEEYFDEISSLKNKGKIAKNSSIFKLCAYLDKNQVLRVESRIDIDIISDELKNPAILSKNSYTTKLIILHYHKLYHHGNHETAINEIRQKYYVPRLRTTFRKIVRKCQMCKINKAKPNFPQMGKLPRARLSAYVSPFTYTGVDFFGPILVVVNRHKEKRYGALFTCLTIRAVHIEIVYSLTSSSCILAIRNFMARRGTPREFFSDNGTNFVGAERELREAIKEIDSNEFVRNFTTSCTKWNFNPPSAPHMGGAWERLVRSVKTTLYKISTSRAPNDEVLHSMMAEVENIVNSRPLTYVPIENENQEALTPNHLLLGCSNGMKPLAEYDDCGVVLKSSWMYTQQYAQQFWKRWLAEYLPSLTCRTKWFEKSKPLCVGDLVVVVDPSLPRNVWPKGKVLETTVSSDGQVRKAKIMTSTGVLERPVVKLAVLDVAQDEE